ncbi:MAG: ABC transporter ATP-binding protein [Desulfamplus sp.]|nr:ABC transporter ATP-binding protein [Desulfamplus sp.]
MKTKKSILKWDNISYSIKSGFFRRNINIIKNINIDLEHNTILGLVGANGAGKTTTLHIGAGFIRPSTGTVTLFDTSISEPSVKKRLGYLAEIQYPFKYLKLNEWLVMLGKLSGINNIELNRRIELLVDILELQPLYKRGISTFSKGQLQRASLAQAILHKPDVLILDEPMSGLDTYWRHHFKSFLKYFKKNGGSAIFSSHVLTDIEEIADYVVFIESGNVKWQSEISELSDLIQQKIVEKDFAILS